MFSRVQNPFSRKTWMSSRPEVQKASPPATTCSPGPSTESLSHPRNTIPSLEQACRVFGSATCKYTRTDSDGFKSVASMNLSVGKTLGRGAYGNVKAVYCESSSHLMALKVISKTATSAHFLPREIEFLQMVSHPHIIAAHHIVETEHKVFILMDLAQNGDLRSYIRSRSYLPKEEARHLFSQVAEGVQFLHSNGIAHRDLKCENILLDHNMSVKIADFGFVINVTRCPVTTTCGSYAYAAPELFSRDTESYNALKTDVWSLGVVLFAMLTGRLVFGNDATAIRNLNNRHIFFPPAIPFTDTLKDLILRMLRKNPSSRYTCHEVVQHAWVADGRVAKPAAEALKYTKDNLDIQPCSQELLNSSSNNFSSPVLLSIPSAADVAAGPQPRKHLCFVCNFFSRAFSALKSLIMDAQEVDFRVQDPQYIEHIFAAL